MVDQLGILICRAPRRVTALFNQRHIGRLKSRADVLGQRKVDLSIAAALVILKNAADTAGSVRVENKEIRIGPGFETRIVGFTVQVEMHFLLAMELGRIVSVLDRGIYV